MANKKTSDYAVLPGGTITSSWLFDIANPAVINYKGTLTEVAQNVSDETITGLDTTADSVVGAINENFDRAEITNGHIVETINLVITSSGSVITASLDAAVGSTLTFAFSDGLIPVDVSTPKTAVLTAGSDTVPQENWLYVLQSDPTTLVVSTSDYPDDSTTEYAPIGRVIVQTAATVLSTGVMKQHNSTDHIKSDGGLGHIHDINEWIREQWATYISGVAQTITGSGTATLLYAVTSGVVKQLHSQVFPAISSPANLYVINDSVSPYKRITDFGGGVLLDSAGGSLTNKYYNLIIWGIASKSGAGQSKLILNLPSGSYVNQTQAEEDLSKFSNFSIPSAYKGVGFLVQRILIKNLAGSTFTVIETEDLRGKIPSNIAGSSVAVGTEFPDSVFRVFNTADNSKEIALDISGVTPSNTRNLKMSDADLDLQQLFTSNQYVLNVDKTKGNDTTGTGSVEFPFLTIQAALDAMGRPINLTDASHSYVIDINSGTYTENLIVPAGRVSNIISHGSVTVSGNFTIETDNTVDFYDRPFTILSTDTFAQPTTLRPAQVSSFYITGNFIITPASTATAKAKNDVMLQGVKIGGIYQTVDTAIEVDDHKLILHYCFFDANPTNITGAGSANDFILERATSTEFDGLVSVTRWESAINCEIWDVTVTAVPSGEYRPFGFRGCDFRSRTFTGIASSFLYDASCVNIPTLAGGATKAYISEAENIGYDNSVSGLTAIEVQAAIDEVAALTGDGVTYQKLTVATPAQTVFTLTHAAVNPGTAQLTLNGITQTYGVDFTVSGTTLTWLDPGGLTLLTTDVLQVWYDIDLAPNMFWDRVGTDLTPTNATDNVDMKKGYTQYGDGTSSGYSIVVWNNNLSTKPVLLVNSVIMNVSGYNTLKWVVADGTAGAGRHLESYGGAAWDYVTTRSFSHSVRRSIGYAQNGNLSSGTRQIWNQEYDASTGDLSLSLNADGVIRERMKEEFAIDATQHWSRNNTSRPVAQDFYTDNDDMGQLFDCYWNGTNFISSSTTGNIRIWKKDGALQIDTAMGVAAGSTITFSTAIVIQGSSGNFVFNKDALFKVYNTAVATPPTSVQLDAAFGTPVHAGVGFTAYINDGGTDTIVYSVMSTGTQWFYNQWSKVI